MQAADESTELLDLMGPETAGLVYDLGSWLTPEPRGLRLRTHLTKSPKKAEAPLDMRLLVASGRRNPLERRMLMEPASGTMSQVALEQ